MAAEPAATAGPYRCVQCNGQYHLDDLSVEFGLDSTGQTIYLGYCQHCRPRVTQAPEGGVILPLVAPVAAWGEALPADFQGPDYSSKAS